MIKETSTN